MRTKFIYFFLIIIQYTGAKDLSARSDDISELIESFSIVTDRSLYSSGENIFFFAQKTEMNGIIKKEFSKVLYVDIITPDGMIINSARFPVFNSFSYGALSIPENALTGTYYLRCYTKWMRNFDHLNYSYISLKVINPEGYSQIPLELYAGDQYNLSGSTNEIRSSEISVNLSRDSYKTRENVLFTIESNLEGEEIGVSRLVISVIPEYARGQQLWNQNLRKLVEDGIIRYIPETRGISITGKVINSLTGNTVPFSPVFLTLLDAERHFYPVISDSAGFFYIPLPDYKGRKELFVSSGKKGDEGLEVLIDSDYSLASTSLPSPGIKLDSSGYTTALRIVQNQQLKSQYFPDEFPEIQNEFPEHFFYGLPDRLVDIDLYIDLPSLEEYFLELLPVVRVIREKGIPSFRITGPQAEMQIYDPLVMIDGVVIHNNEAVLEINPRNIDKIEIIERPWLRGDIIFGGIISIRSKNNDFAGVDLPESGLFLTYRFFEPAHKLPQESMPLEAYLPDVRNTLFWDPQFILKPGEKKTLNFRTADTKGAYMIVIKKITPEGEILETIRRFRVE